MKTTQRFFLYAIFLMVLSTTLFSGCKKEEEKADAYQVLADYLVAQQLDLNVVLTDFVKDITTETDANAVSAMYVIDIRSASEFAKGHIANAHRVDMKDILTEAEKAAAGQDILVVCETGQKATYASTLLRLAGFSKSKALKWGMSRWNSTLDQWTPGIGNIAQGHANWTTEAAPANLTYAAPKIPSSNTEGQAILLERIEKVLNDGYKGIQPDVVLANPNNYFINNFFSEVDYLAYGHIKGAKRIQPLRVGPGETLFLDPSKEIVTYCYTGQTSGAITAYLRVLGYNATSMMWGMNKLSNANTAWGTSGNKWTADKSKSFSVIK